MSIYDYHRRLLSSDVWKSDELSLAPRARQQIVSQLERRFPEATRAFVVGDLAGHYYHEGSPFDIIVQTPSAFIEPYKRESDVVSGYALKNTEHGVYFHIIDASVKPEMLAEKFGPLHDISMNRWVGKRVTGMTEIIRPEALLQQIKWRLYKAKEMDEDAYPYEWRVLGEALPHISADERTRLMDELKQVVARLEDNIGTVLNRYNDAAVWRNASTLKNLYDAEEDEDDIREFIDENKVPLPVVLSMLNVARYEDVLDQIENVDERLSTLENLEAEQRGVMLRTITGSAEDERLKEAGKGQADFMRDRLNNLINLLVLKNGGYKNAVDTVYQAINQILENNRYMTTRARRRMVALKIWKKHYRNMKDA